MPKYWLVETKEATLEFDGKRVLNAVPMRDRINNTGHDVEDLFPEYMDRSDLREANIAGVYPQDWLVTGYKGAEQTYNLARPMYELYTREQVREIVLAINEKHDQWGWFTDEIDKIFDDKGE